MEPWLITTPKFEELSEALNAAIANKWMPEAAADSPVGPRAAFSQGYAHPQISVHRGVAFARIHGVMGRGLSALDMECGGFDTGMFREQLKLISEDSSVKALIIDFNTPGGMANGNMAVCKDLRAISESGVKIYAYVGLMCASAGYFVASACDEIHAHPDAIVGSISTIYSGIDSSKAFEMRGLKLELFATGKFKATGTPGKEWSDEERENIWSRIKPIDAEFKGFVAERRGLTADDMEGQWWYAKNAPPGVTDSTAFDTCEKFVESVFASI
jgi:signal peptide peptidase SppA